MTELLPFLKSLLSVSGLSGHETPAARLIEAEWKPLVDEIHFSRVGSLHALKKGAGSEPRPSLLIATHMDAIGLIVKMVVDGFLYTAGVGGVDVRVLPGTPVLVHTSSGELPGVVAMPMSRLLPPGANDNFLTLEHLVVDTGLTPSEVAKRVQMGDLISFDTQPVEMAGEIISGHSLDNRVSVAALTVALNELQSKSHLWDVWAVATTQEEVGAVGAGTSAFQLNPSLAVAVDGTFAKGPGSNGWESFPLGKGVTLGLGPNIHPFLHTRFKELAEKLEIPFAVEPMPASSGTDAMTMQLAADGIPTMVLSIPLRYMHTPVELTALKDIQRAGRLLAEFIGSLEADFIERIVWE
jgi:endoglucanase